MIQNPSRLDVVDALRGFAITAILLLHNIEHFDYYYIPKSIPAWMVTFDKEIWATVFFLFSGKAYAIFSLLFGLTFFIQFDNQQKKGKDFRGRFAWRLVLLFIFGMINTAFFQGDILSIYAILGFCLIPLAKVNSRILWLIAIILMIQPYEWYQVFRAMQQPDMLIPDLPSLAYFDKMGVYIEGDSFINTAIGNLTNGKIAVLHWTWENDRIFQTISLFICGMLLGRRSLFNESEKSKRFWIKTLLIALVTFVAFYFLNLNMSGWFGSKAILTPLNAIENSWRNLAFMLVLVSGFVLIFRLRFFYSVLDIFSPMGRMSLSNYIIQSVMGSFIYYGFGLGLYKYTGALYSVLIAIALALLQGLFSYWWMKKHKQGPLETAWHKLTWMNTKNG